MKWKKIKYNNSKNDNHTLNMQPLQDPVCRQQYSETVAALLEEGRTSESKKKETAQDAWNNIKQACIKAGETIIGKKFPKSKKNTCDTVKTLSQKQKQLGQQINSCWDKAERRKMQKERNNIMKNIHQIIDDEETSRIMQSVEEIETYKNDSNRMYQAVRTLQKKQTKNILVTGEDGLTKDSEEQLEIITNFFEKNIQQRKHRKNGRCWTIQNEWSFHGWRNWNCCKTSEKQQKPGVDSINAELLKYGPNELHGEIANIFNQIAATGEIPTEIQQGILIPIPKPGKPAGPPGNLRLIILNSFDNQENS